MTLKRCGLVARKVGMSRFFTEDGLALPVTLVKIEDNVVISSKTKEKDGYDAVILGYGIPKLRRLKKPIKGIADKIGVAPFAKIKEFRVSSECIIDSGKKISASHFVKDQYLDIVGTSIGKGFAGGMKRHNFSGLEASHGVSISHRAIGSTGNRQDPGKVFKNKKMAGHMGDVRVTVQNVKVIAVESGTGIVILLGSIPGHPGSFLYLSDAIKKAVPASASFPASYIE